MSELDEPREAEPILETAHWQPSWKGRFLDALTRLPNVAAAARSAGISRQRAYQAQEEDAEFAAAWAAARDIGVELMEQIAHRRATVGEQTRTTRITTETDKEGKIVRQVEVIEESTSISNALMIFLLKAYRPEVYRERYEPRHSIPPGGAIVREFEIYRMPTHERMLELARIARELEPGVDAVIEGTSVVVVEEIERPA